MPLALMKGKAWVIENALDLIFATGLC